MKRKYASSILITGALILNAFSDNHGKISKGIEGEWITFRGDNHEIKNISDGKMKSTFYRFDGQVNFERSADITLKDHSAGEQKTIISRRKNKAKNGNISQEEKHQKTTHGQGYLLKVKTLIGKKVKQGSDTATMMMKPYSKTCKTNTQKYLLEKNSPLQRGPS